MDQQPIWSMYWQAAAAGAMQPVDRQAAAPLSCQGRQYVRGQQLGMLVEEHGGFARAAVECW